MRVLYLPTLLSVSVFVLNIQFDWNGLTSLVRSAISNLRLPKCAQLLLDSTLPHSAPTATHDFSEVFRVSKHDCTNGACSLVAHRHLCEACAHEFTLCTLHSVFGSALAAA